MAIKKKVVKKETAKPSKKAPKKPTSKPVKKKAAPRGKEVKPTCYFSIDVKGSKCVVQKVGHNERLAEALIQSYDMINEVRTLLSMVFGKLVIRTNQMEQKENIKPAKNKK